MMVGTHFHLSAGGILHKPRHSKYLRLIQCHSGVGKRSFLTAQGTKTSGKKDRFPSGGVQRKRWYSSRNDCFFGRAEKDRGPEIDHEPSRRLEVVTGTAAPQS